MRHSRLPRSGVGVTADALILENRSPSLALVMLVFLLTRTSRFGLGRPRSSPTASSVSALAAETRPRPRGAADSAGSRGGAAAISRRHPIPHLYSCCVATDAG